MLAGKLYGAKLSGGEGLLLVENHIKKNNSIGKTVWCWLEWFRHRRSKQFHCFRSPYGAYEWWFGGTRQIVYRRRVRWWKRRYQIGLSKNFGEVFRLAQNLKEKFLKYDQVMEWIFKEPHLITHVMIWKATCVNFRSWHFSVKLKKEELWIPSSLSVLKHANWKLRYLIFYITIF